MIYGTNVSLINLTPLFRLTIKIRHFCCYFSVGGSIYFWESGLPKYSLCRYILHQQSWHTSDETFFLQYLAMGESAEKVIYTFTKGISRKGTWITSGGIETQFVDSIITRITRSFTSIPEINCFLMFFLCGIGLKIR